MAGFKTAWAVNGLMNLEQYRRTAEFDYQTASFEKVPRSTSTNGPTPVS